MGRVSTTGSSSQVSVDSNITVSWELVRTIIMLCAGGWDENSLDSILQFDGETQQWEQIGQLRLKRYFHATSVININEIAAYLNCD